MNAATLVVLWLALAPGTAILPEPGDQWRAVRGFADLDMCEAQAERARGVAGFPARCLPPGAKPQPVPRTWQATI